MNITPGGRGFCTGDIFEFSILALGLRHIFKSVHQADFLPQGVMFRMRPRRNKCVTTLNYFKINNINRWLQISLTRGEGTATQVNPFTQWRSHRIGTDHSRILLYFSLSFASYFLLYRVAVNIQIGSHFGFKSGRIFAQKLCFWLEIAFYPLGGGRSSRFGLGESWNSRSRGQGDPC